MLRKMKKELEIKNERINKTKHIYEEKNIGINKNDGGGVKRKRRNGRWN